MERIDEFLERSTKILIPLMLLTMAVASFSMSIKKTVILFPEALPELEKCLTWDQAESKYNVHGENLLRYMINQTECRN